MSLLSRISWSTPNTWAAPVANGGASSYITVFESYGRGVEVGSGVGVGSGSGVGSGTSVGAGRGATVCIGTRAGIGVEVGGIRTITWGVAVGAVDSSVPLPHEAQTAANTIKADRMYALFVSAKFL